jgi:hypothetical protein
VFGSVGVVKVNEHTHRLVLVLGKVSVDVASEMLTSLVDYLVSI